MSKLEVLKQASREYLSALASIEDSNNQELKDKASEIVQANVIHEGIALEEMQS